VVAVWPIGGGARARSKGQVGGLRKGLHAKFRSLWHRPAWVQATPPINPTPRIHRLYNVKRESELGLDKLLENSAPN